MTEPHRMSALAQAGAMANGELSPVELTRHYLNRIEAADRDLGAYLTVTADTALKQAADAEERLLRARDEGRALPPLFGVPIPVKDLVEVEGVPFTRGSAAYRHELGERDDHVVTRLREAGTILLGKTNTPEFGLPCYTENRIAAPTRNPWDPARSPGGSSGGAAAAVAAGLAPAAHGTDAGGSVRIPAAVCGLVGFKPGRGRISDGPSRPDVSGLSVHGALARDVADAAALLDAMSGRMPGDVYTAPGHPDGATLLEHARREPRRLRVAGLKAPLVSGSVLHPDCAAAYEYAARMLCDLGHEVDELEMPPDDDLAEIFARVWSVEAASHPIEAGLVSELTPFTAYLRERADSVTARQYQAALATFRGVGQMLTDLLLSAYDVILSPTVAEPAPLIGEFSALEPAEAFARMTAFMPYTATYNIAGMPAISLPLHWNSANLPIGVMLAGAYGEEALLASLGAQLQDAAAPGRPQPPY